MEATKNPKTDAQRDQHLAVCRHIYDNIIFNYGSVENYIAVKNTEINTAESKLQSYYDNPRKGKSRRAAIITGLENTIFLMKNGFTNTLSELEELNATTLTETPQIVRVEIVRDFDNTYYANLYDENGGSHNLSHEYTDFRTLKTLCKKEYGVSLPNLSQIKFETHGRKSYAYISTETPRISTETAETANVSAEGESAAERAKNEPRKGRMKSYARITGQHNRLWLAANGNKARQDRISAIWYRYTANISKHFKNPFMSEWDAHGTDELPRSIYAATNAPQSPET